MKQRLQTHIGDLNEKGIGWLFLLVFFTCGQYAHGQMKNTEHKADRNLKSAARINPSTLAMEFSIPLGSYPGRGGNAFPLALTYSSKVWHRKSYEPLRQHRYFDLRQPPYDVVTVNNSMARFGRRSISGWTSSFQAPAIIKEFEIYNQAGEIHSVSPAPVDEFQSCLLPGGVTECHSGIIFHSQCASGWASYYGCATCWPDGFCTLDSLDVVCMPMSPNPNPGPLPVPSPVPTPTPEIPYGAHRIRVNTPDGSSQEFRKDESVSECPSLIDCLTFQDGTYLSVNGSGLVLKVGDTSIDGARKAVLYMPDGTKYIFPDLQSSTASLFLQSAYFIDRNGNKVEFRCGKQ